MRLKVGGRQGRGGEDEATKVGERKQVMKEVRGRLDINRRLGGGRRKVVGRFDLVCRAVGEC